MSSKRYRINEIFKSLQGEGTYAGVPCVFVRFAGCNLDCNWCDTDHQKANYNLRDTMVLEMIQRVAGPNDVEMVVLTGGEPTLQLDEKLVRLLSDNYSVHLETNGTREIPYARWIQWTTVSPKAGQPLAVTHCDELKVVLDKKVDPEEYFDEITALVYSIQPLSQDYKSAVKYVLDNPGWRLSLQQHKVLGIQ